jgi:hypothetical protein
MIECSFDELRARRTLSETDGSSEKSNLLKFENHFGPSEKNLNPATMDITVALFHEANLGTSGTRELGRCM